MEKSGNNSQPAIELRHQQSFYLTACETLGSGHKLRFTLTGSSMLPFLRESMRVEVAPLNGRPPRVGEILLYRCPENKLILHRLLATDNNRYYCRGDAHRSAPEAILKNSILGRLTQYQKQKSTGWRHYGRLQQLVGLSWVHGYPLLFPMAQFLGRARRGLLAHKPHEKSTP